MRNNRLSLIDVSIILLIIIIQYFEEYLSFLLYILCFSDYLKKYFKWIYLFKFNQYKLLLYKFSLLLFLVE